MDRWMNRRWAHSKISPRVFEGAENEIRIDISQPFSLEQSAECGQAFRWTQKNGQYYSVVGRNILRIRQDGRAIFATLFPYADKSRTLKILGELFRFDDDLNQILAEISFDRHISESVSRHFGLRLIRQDPWECLISYLCSINSNIPRIKGDVERLSSHYGDEIKFDDTVFHTFPTVDALADVDELELRKLKLGFRSKYIAAAARKVRDEKIHLSSFRHLSYEDAFERLLSFYGVGPKVADCVLLFSMDKLEAFPVDRWVKRGVEVLYFKGTNISEQRVREWAATHFGRFAGYAQEYLFYGSRLKEIIGAGK